jgi:putative endonuclease
LTSRAAAGDAAERLAARHLEERGYRIVARNVRSKVGELDLVARDGEVLCFIEVRLRRDGRGAESVDAGKRRRLVRAARQYLVARRLGEPRCRFDVVAVTVDPPSCAILRDAF